MPRPPFYVFAHDLGRTPLQWEDTVVALPPGAGAVCPWLRGTRPGGERVAFTVDGAAAGLLSAMDEQGAARATLVGSGLGGTIALLAAAQAPERVERVVGVGALPQPSARAVRVQRAAMRLVPRRTLAARNIDKDRLLDALAAAAQSDVAGALGAVAAPVTLVVGQGDRRAAADAETLRGVIPQAVVETLPRASEPYGVEPAALNRLLFGDAPGRPAPGGAEPGSDISGDDWVPDGWDLT